MAAFFPAALLYGGNWKYLWPIFGASNQLLAAMSLVVLTVYLIQKGRPHAPVLLPMFYVAAVTILALFGQAWGHYQKGNHLLLGLSLVMAVLGIWTLAEGHLAKGRAHAGHAPPERLR